MNRVGQMLALLVVAAVLVAVIGPLKILDTGLPSIAAADARFVVDSEQDAVDAEPGDGECRTEDGECTLRAAVMEANALPGPDAVEVPAGTYPVSIPAEPHDPPAAGDIDITDELEIVGAGSADTIVKGPGGQDLWSVFGIDRGVSVTLTGLQVREGSGAFGGGIDSEGTLRLRDSSVVSNTAGYGGGIDSDGELLVYNSEVLSNTADFGGGISAMGPVYVADSRIEDNTAAHGGGVRLDYHQGPETASFSDTVIKNNDPTGIQADSGGTVLLTDSDVISNAAGVEIDQGNVIAVGSRVQENRVHGIRAQSGFATVSDTDVSHNGVGMAGSSSTLRALASHFTGNEGSAITDFNKGTVVVAASSVVSNTGSFGGGIGMSNQGALTLVDSTVAGNRAAHGGGIYVGNGGEHFVENSTLSGNHASIGDNIRNGGDLTLESSTVWTTVGEGRGLGINNSSLIQLRSSVLAAGPGAVSCAPSTAGSIVSGGHNVSSDDSCGLDEDLGDQVDVDPQLGPLADNGGRTKTHELLADSPAIDHGVEFGCPDFDQRGVSRPQGEGCDSGSFEFGAEAPPVPTPSRDFAITELRVLGYALTAPDGEEPVVGATVTVQALPGRCLDAPVVTDENGAFDVTCPIAHLLGAVTVEIEAAGYDRWRGGYMLGPFGEERGPVAVDAMMTWAGGPTPTPTTPSPEPTNTPTPGSELYVPAAER